MAAGERSGAVPCAGQSASRPARRRPVEPTAAPETAHETNGKPESSSGKTVEVHNPATGQLIGSVPAMSPEDVGRAVERARAAQPAWDALGFAERGRILRRMQKWTLDNSE